MENRFNIKFYKGIKRILNLPFKLVFHPKVRGLENLPNKPYILVGNHKSLLDIPLLIIYVNEEIHFMAKKELFKNKRFGGVLYKMGAFPVDREKTDIGAIKNSFQKLKNGNVLGVFPEGTRNKTDDKILPFKDGVSAIATKTGTLVVPFGISGKYNFFRRIKLYIGEPIDMSKIDKLEQTKYLEEKVKKLII